MSTREERTHTRPRPDHSDSAGALAKIVATIGPASESADMVRRLIEAGVSVFRFNFSHGDLDAHERRLRTVREAAAAAGRPVACLGDLQGPKVRVGKVPEGGLMLEPGRDCVFRRGVDTASVRSEAAGGGASGAVVLPTTYPAMIDEALPGQRVLVNDGAIRMLAVDRSADGMELRCRVTVGGLVTSGKGINLPQAEMSAPSMSERDWECVSWAVEHELDYLALSFVRRAAEVVALRARICTMKGGAAWIPIIAKIEKPQAMDDLEAIVRVSDGIMVARGDLGVEMDIARVPVAQKEIIAACQRQGKPCIVATQMLETMITSPIPTRAEASDVANAIFDGADAVMLSAETATGKHPALVVETMRRIVLAAEAHLAMEMRESSPPERPGVGHETTAALAHGAWQIAKDLDARVVVCWSENGGTARYLSQNGFAVPIVAYSSSAVSARRMALLRGVTPVQAAPPDSGRLADWNLSVDKELLGRGLCGKGDYVVLLAGRPLGKAKATNTIAVHRVGEDTGGYRAH